MCKIYRRYNTNQHNPYQRSAATEQKPAAPPSDTAKKGSAPARSHQQQSAQPRKAAPSLSPQIHKPAPPTSAQQARGQTASGHHKAPMPQELPHKKEEPPKSKAEAPLNPLLGLIPRHIYNPDSKKILGFLSSEDLLLIALIFLFMESSEEDNPLMVLALVYVLLGEYIDFGDFAI